MINNLPFSPALGVYHAYSMMFRSWAAEQASTPAVMDLISTLESRPGPQNVSVARERVLTIREFWKVSAPVDHWLMGKARQIRHFWGDSQPVRIVDDLLGDRSFYDQELRTFLLQEGRKFELSLSTYQRRIFDELCLSERPTSPAKLADELELTRGRVAQVRLDFIRHVRRQRLVWLAAHGLSSQIPPESVEHLGLSDRITKILKRGQVDSIGRLMDLNIDDLLKLKGLSRSALTEIRWSLKTLGLSLKQDRAVETLTVEGLGLTKKTASLLRKAGIDTVGRLVTFSKVQILQKDGIGRRSFKEIQNALAARSLSLRESPESDLKSLPIEKLELSFWGRTGLKELRIATIGQLADLSLAEMLSRKLRRGEIAAALEDLGLDDSTQRHIN